MLQRNNIKSLIGQYSLIPYHKYGSAITSHDLLKAIAITLMILDHIGHYFMPYCQELRLVGRFSFPLFFFLIGYSHSYRFKWDVLILAGVMIVQDMTLQMPILPTNILVNVVITRLVLGFIAQKNWLDGQWSGENVISVAIVIFSSALLLGLLVDFGIFGLMLALCGYLVRKQHNKRLIISALIITGILYSIMEIMIFKFSLLYSGILVIGLALLFLGFYYYRQKAYVQYTDSQILVHGVMLLSRYSLYIYVIHLMIFKLMKVMEYPELYMGGIRLL